jgi:Helix-turn-helix domain
MIGRTEPLKPFEAIRWAKARAREKDSNGKPRLRQLEAQLLLVLATYAGEDGVAFPSVKRLAENCALKADPSHSGVHRALRRLEDLGLIWTRQAGRGHPARRELLVQPAEQFPTGNSKSTEQQSPHGDGKCGAGDGSAVPGQGHELSPDEDTNYQANGQEEMPKNRTARGSSPSMGTASDPSSGRADDELTAAEVRSIVAASLAQADAAGAA